MKENGKHIKKVKIVSNTHWDREFRRSFERTRRGLIRNLDTTLDILEEQPEFHSFLMDGHTIMIDDYLEMRPERTEQVTKLIQAGKLKIGPYYTLAEQFSVTHEATVRNMIFGKRGMEKYGAPATTVAYTPSSWGQTGQYPQILSDFGLKYMMFYRGVSHHECDAEYVWKGPDGTEMTASRFGLFCRYNYYYQVFRSALRGKVFDKTFDWGVYDDAPVRVSDGLGEEEENYDLKDPEASLNFADNLEQNFRDMIEKEGAHFTSDTFLAMNGHDISVAHPNETDIVSRLKEIFDGEYEIEHTDLEGFWADAEKTMDKSKLAVLEGERRAYLKEGMWTFLFPATISARTYLKQKDFFASNKLTNIAEPIAALAATSGFDYPHHYADRAWQYLLSNHTHDANGGCAPDPVAEDMIYRYNKVDDIGSIITEDAASHIITNLSSEGQEKTVRQLVAFNTLAKKRDVVSYIDLEVPTVDGEISEYAKVKDGDSEMKTQLIDSNKSSIFADSIWEVPSILDTQKVQLYAELKDIPAMGYKTFTVEGAPVPKHNETLITGNNSMANEHLSVSLNSNGTVNIKTKDGRVLENVNYFTDEGEAGNAWEHVDVKYDQKVNSLGVNASLCIEESGALRSTLRADFDFVLPEDYTDGTKRSEHKKAVPVSVFYTLEKGCDYLKVKVQLDNTVKDHWLRVNFPTKTGATHSFADSHYDVVKRDIALPDCTGWVEQARGTHPLRTFVDLNDGKNGLAVMPRGLFEYEAFEDEGNTLALTLIRACRIKIKVSEERQTELDDKGIQCPGPQEFEYAIYPHSGDVHSGNVAAKALEYDTLLRLFQAGRGKGNLDRTASFFELDTTDLVVTAVKEADDKEGTIIRLYNTKDESVKGNLTFGQDIASASLCKMDESATDALSVNGNSVALDVTAKKIITLKIV